MPEQRPHVVLPSESFLDCQFVVINDKSRKLSTSGEDTNPSWHDTFPLFGTYEGQNWRTGIADRHCQLLVKFILSKSDPDATVSIKINTVEVGPVDLGGNGLREQVVSKTFSQKCLDMNGNDIIFTLQSDDRLVHVNDVVLHYILEHDRNALELRVRR